jgi:hypothetical protein
MGNTSLLVTLGTDDHADGRAGAAPLTPSTTPGTSVTGRFDFPADPDCLAVPVVAGHIYTLEETTSTDVNLEVLTAAGTHTSNTTLDQLRFRATTTETLYLCTRAATSSSLATWTLRATDEGLDDHANDRVGASTLVPATSPGGAVAGQFNYAGDVDCLAVPVQANRVYDFSESTATDVYLYVLTETGTYISLTDSESVRFRTTTAETLYLCTRAYTSTSLAAWRLVALDLGVDDHADDRVGAAQLTPAATPATISGVFQFPGDPECVVVPVQAGHIYTFAETTSADVYLWVLTATGTFISLTDTETLRFEATQAEPLYLCTRAYTSTNYAAWTLSAADLGVDDHADDRTNAALLTPASQAATISGLFQFPGDPECVQVPVQANRIYDFSETTSTDVYLWVLTATGTFIATTDNESVRFKTSQAETLYLCTRAYTSTNYTSWTLAANDLGPDDFADDRVGAPPLPPMTGTGNTVSGVFQFPSDPECVSVPVQAGNVYEFAEITATDIYLWVLTGTGTLFGITDNESVRFKAATTETLYLCTKSYYAGTYSPWTLRTLDLGPDDHPDTRTNATPLVVDGLAVPGAIQFAGDADFFTFDATTVLALRAITTGIGVTVQVQNASGGVVATGTGPGTWAFALPAAGTYSVRITSAGLGAYTLAIAN